MLPDKGQVPIKTAIVVLAVASLVGCSAKSAATPAQTSVGSTGAGTGTQFCQDFNSQIDDAMTKMGEGAASNIEPTVASLQQALVLFGRDLRSAPPEAKAKIKLGIEGVQQEIQHIRAAGTLAIIDQEGLAPKVTDMTIEDGDYCA